MKRYLLLLAALWFCSSSCSEKALPTKYSEAGNKRDRVLMIDPSPDKGFNWPFLLYIPEKAGETLVVIPNNTGQASDDFGLHLENAAHELEKWISEEHEFIYLMPVFPRFRERMGGWKLYTHALDRDSMTIRPERKIAVSVEWQGEWLDPQKSSISFNLDDLFVVQDNRLSRAIACDEDPTERITGVSEFGKTFLFDDTFDFTRPFTFLEYPYSIHVREVYKSEGGMINNSCSAGSGTRITEVGFIENAPAQRWKNREGRALEDRVALMRLDIQLINMAKMAGSLLEEDLNIKLEEKFSMLGFSASGMFTDRFCHLHPELVKAAAYGSPGGLPMFPLENFRGVPLPYPVGVSDIKEITGRPFSPSSFKGIRRFIFLGEEDENDSVPYPDGFDGEERSLVLSIIGETPMERHRLLEEVLEREGFEATRFRYYPDIGHTVTDEARKEMHDFLEKRQ